MKQLKATYNNIELYNAGLPGFPRNFTRDSIISGLLMQDPELLKNQLLFSASRQGKKTDPYTGEEFGKIFHEFPGYVINNLSTEFNACDTTALFLIGHDHYHKHTGDSTLKELHKENLSHAVQYIKSHLVEDIFYENPSLSGAERFALKVTYWKDSVIPRRNEGIPSYPIAYFLAHVVNLAGVRSAAKLLQSEELEQIAEKMKSGLNKFFDKDEKSFYIAIDAQGPIKGVSSDMLHALFYLESGDLTEEQLDAIKSSSSELETPVGYLVLTPKLREQVKNPYHSSTVWPYEQAVINIGARKFNLHDIEQISRRVYPHLDTAPEIFVLTENETRKGGCDPQLWTLAAKKYFESLPLDEIVLENPR